MHWVARLFFSQINLFDDKTPSQYYFSFDTEHRAGKEIEKAGGHGQEAT